MAKRIQYKKENVALRGQIATLLQKQQSGQLGGNQNSGATYYAIGQSGTTDAGLAGPSGFNFGIAQPDISGYDDGNPFTAFSPNATGNTGSLVNQSSGGLTTANGVTAGTPNLNAQPQNDLDATKLQIQWDTITTARYAVYVAGGLVALFLVFKYVLKK